MAEEVKRFIEKARDKAHDGTPGVLATIDQDGYPNAAPKFFKIIDSNHISFPDIFSKRLRENIQKNPNVSVIFFDARILKGYRIRGKAELEEEGPMFEAVTQRLKKIGLKPKTLVKIRIQEIRLLQYGPDAGKLIG